MNLTMLAKLGWKLASGEECLGTRMMKAKYLHNETFFSYTPKQDASWVWKGIVKSRDILRKGVCFRIRDDTSIDFNLNWKADVVRQLFDDDAVEAILRLEWPEVSCSDKLVWLESKEGEFSVKSCYELLVKNSSRKEESDQWKKL
ncbi:hypothetical protein FEM48_Zijuj06G0189800 [Ziziphus jujuba var. spinosa]|uniref:Uncharacterized protein n=1 Tax=Ziziphus jujuba var. spinosa TaxID=714518 RepID=A0A978VB19_ZIZJJ|nr:hypothetical protein FEM48_Zijuj06G0189800 [Ziziphus jujuba var. spinosa]